eukprot:UC1_evm4s288
MSCDAAASASAVGGGGIVGAVGGGDGSSPPSLKELLLHGEDALTKLPTLSALSDEYRTLRASAEGALKTCAEGVQQLDLFSANEHYGEHGAPALRMLLLPAYRGELVSRRTAERDDPDRDAKRETALKEAIALFRDFLRQCRDMELPFAEREHVSFYLELEPGTKRDRAAKVEHMRGLKESETTHSGLKARLARLEEDDELAREAVLSLLAVWVYKACDQIESLGSEMAMLQQMAAFRASGRRPAAPPSQPRGPPQPPLVLTKERVREMASTGKGMARADFQLITRGHGPIGAPTRTLEEQADIELAQAMEQQARSAEHAAANPPPEEDSEAAADAETYKARQMDLYKDDHKRGSGNRYNMG